MNTVRKSALTALSRLVKRGGLALSADDHAMINEHPDRAGQHSQRVGEIYDAVFRGFFICAAEGEALCPEDKVAKKFGSSVADNYPQASKPFLKFAISYWTLQVLIFDLLEHDMNWIGGHLLGKLEQQIGPVFFPIPGPRKIAPSEREKFQRKLLAEYGANIDAEEFMRGNPILIRDRQPTLWGKLKSLFRGA